MKSLSVYYLNFLWMKIGFLLKKERIPNCLHPFVFTLFILSLSLPPSLLHTHTHTKVQVSPLFSSIGFKDRRVQRKLITPPVYRWSGLSFNTTIKTEKTIPLSLSLSPFLLFLADLGQWSNMWWVVWLHDIERERLWKK